ncbi:hypothetical protein CTEN210_05361 [Chaetoceros tenuissimus]|uniref:Uncharacterized protein n=1 Tax=Chaetoceros tenuissimus TaxID=426638 RepID=A0AAD3CQB8_9STRA|nr:hypothetical protein CTEN210_05361 [Chaetoceros tenuissimus]
MPFGKKPEIMEEIIDPTAWMLDNTISDFLLIPTVYMSYMFLLGYAFKHGCKVFKLAPADASVSFKLLSLAFACTGGGILVPIFINSVPVPLVNDAYPVAIIAAFALHHYFPILREVAAQSSIIKVILTVMYEAQRAGVVTKITVAAGKAIAPSMFDIAIFGPIFCGATAGCGGAFMPLNKGLDPIKGGLPNPVLTALTAATCLHFFLSTSLSEGCINPIKKAQVMIALFFITVSIVSDFGLSANKTVTKAKKE